MNESFRLLLFSLEEGEEAMNAPKFIDAQMVFIVKQGREGTTAAEICCKSGISPARYLEGKKKYEGLMPSEIRRVHDLEDENNRLKRIFDDLTLDRGMS